MTKSKKKEAKEGKELSIPPLPDPIFVIELENEVLITAFAIEECSSPHYRFDNDCDGAFKAATDIATKKKILITDAVNYNIDDPHTYDPVKLEAQNTALMLIINAERAKVRESWLRQDKEKKKRAGLDRS